MAEKDSVEASAWLGLAVFMAAFRSAFSHPPDGSTSSAL
jgi:hypothetical protein